QNEEGIYLGLQHAIGSKVTLSAYMDQFYFPAARFGTHQSTSGYDWLVRAEAEFNRKLEVYLQLRSQTKEEEYEVLDELGRSRRKLGEEGRSGIRANVAYWVNEKIRLRMRGEWIRSQKAGEEAESGYLLYQDLRLLLRGNLKI